jgi:ribosomal 50S subunit-associated protein YjgA (DUF615 family)
LWLNNVANWWKRRNCSSFARSLYWFDSNHIKIVWVSHAWKMFYDSFFVYSLTRSAINVFRSRFVRCEIAKSIKREHVRIAEIFRVQSNSRKRQISCVSKFFRISCLKATRKTMSCLTKRRTRNQSYLLRIFVAKRTILFAIAVNDRCEFDVIWELSYDRRRDAFNVSNRVCRSESNWWWSRMNLLFYENRNIRFWKNFASVVWLSIDSWTYREFDRYVRTICEEFLQ